MHAWPTISSLLLTMGCTSSAPNMADIQINTTENTGVKSDLETINKDLNENAQETTTIPENGSKTLEVLPTCDNLDENIQLDRQNSSKSISIQQIENDDHNCSIDYGNELSPLYTESREEKITSLKDIVDQVMIDNILEDKQNASVSSDIVDEVIVDESTFSDRVEEILESKDSENEDLNEIVQKEEPMEESSSPSQSECSRSTRWEALADIAAELPASLAVDPLTGQIYSLTK